MCVSLVHPQYSAAAVYCGAAVEWRRSSRGILDSFCLDLDRMEGVDINWDPDLNVARSAL